MIASIVLWLMVWAGMYSDISAFRAERLYQLKLSARGYEIESEIMMRALHARLRTVEVPIHVPFAVKGATAWDGLRVAWYKVKLGLALKLGLVKA